MKYINLFFFLSVLAPMAVRADTASDIGDTVVPFQRIYDAVQEWPQLYDTDFVFLLGERVTEKNYTLQKVAQACIDYTDYNNAVTKDICKEFVAAAFGQSDVDQPVTEERSEAVTDGVILTTTDDMPTEAEIKITIHAAGQFNVDCDNGEMAHTINNADIEKKDITCEYPTGGVHNIKITGLATNYPEYDAEDPGVIYFNESPYLKSVQGSLGSIFPTLKGEKQPNFAYAFSGCTNLTTIPPDLFKGVTGKADGMFDSTFLECESLTTIPKNLFKGVTGAAAKMFASTFLECESLTTIPKNLFKGVTGAAEEMFFSTFDSCTGLREIPTGLFDGVNAAADGMFRATFYGCNALTTIPEDLFKGVNAAAEEMFYGTFYGCSSLTDIPEDLFKGVTGKADGMFDGTFEGVPPDVVPDNIFPGENDAADKVIEKNADTGTAAGYGNVTLTTTYMPAEAEITITIYAAGMFNVDCDDGKPAHTIDNTTIKIQDIECGYPTGGVHEIKITGLATDYPKYDAEKPGVIYFNESEYLESVQGSLGSIFPTLKGGKQPNFAYAFSGCTNLTTIPPDLFDGVTGAAEGMFFQTFEGCSELTAIPDGLFDGVNVAAAEMFRGTFYGCSALTDIPAGLFEHVTGAANDMFMSTFSDCTSLTTIPPGLFKGVKGKAANMFRSTFSECTNLTTIPPGLFKGVKGKADGMFFQTFSWCTNLTTIPPGLFDGVTGAADSMFTGTFWNCTHLTKIPDGLFDGVNAAAAEMFRGTFQDCRALTTIPEDLFDGVTGKADDMFTGTFGRVPGVPDAVNAKMKECNIPSDGE